MTQGIHIKSLEALHDFQTSLVLYRHEAEDALDKAETEAEQALAEVGDALSTALQQIEDSRDELAQARDDLSTCQGGYGDEEDDEPDCSAEEQAVADAEETLRKVEERAEALQHARNRLEEAVQAYRSQARCLKEFLEIDLLRANGTLAAKIEAIEAYLAVAAPATPSLPGSAPTASSLKTASALRREPQVAASIPGTHPRTHHTAQVMVMDASGRLRHSERIVSGSMTPEERVLGFPKNTLASHTEARAVRNIPLQKGESMIIEGQRPPCPACKGAMKRSAKESGATIIYQWPENGMTLTWTAGN